jgi:hypothetical protein
MIKFIKKIKIIMDDLFNQPITLNKKEPALWAGSLFFNLVTFTQVRRGFTKYYGAKIMKNYIIMPFLTKIFYKFV